MKISSLIYELKQVRKSVGDIDIKIALGIYPEGGLAPIDSVNVYPTEVKRTDRIPYVCVLEIE